MSLILSLIHSEIPSVLDEECTCTYCGYFLTPTETDICNRCRKDLKRKITETSCNEKLYKITGTKRRTIIKEDPWLQQELRTANAEEIKEVSEQKAFLENYFLQNGVEMKYIDEYCKLKKLTFESFISNLKSKIKKLGDYECNYTDNLIKLFYFRNEGVPPLELIERFQKCLNDQEFINDQEFLYSYFFQYKVQMEDIVKYCKYEKQINLESFISDLKSKIQKLWDTQYNYSGKRRVKIGVKKLIQLFYLRNERVSRLKCIELFQNCLDDYLEKFKQCKQECMVNIMRLRDEDIEHVGKKKLRPAKEESYKSYSPNFTSSASEKVNESNLEVTRINEANLEATNKLRPAKEESQKSCSSNFTSSASEKVKVNEANLEAKDMNEANLEATDRDEPSNSNNPIFVYEENASTNNSDDQSDENTLTKKSNASEKLFGPHSVSKNNKIEDEHLFSKLASDFLEMDFSARHNKRQSECNNNKRTSDITTQKIPSSVCTNDVTDDASSRVISIEQINRNRQKERKSEDFSVENDIRKKGSKNETHDIDAQKIIKDVEISHIASQKESSVVCKKDIKEDVLSKIISVERTDGNIQKEIKAGDFSIDNDSRKKDSKKETLLERDIDAQKSIKNVEISDSKSQKTSIISVEQTDGNMQKERNSGNFNIDNDIRKKDSKKETLLKRGIDTEKIIKNAEISDTASQKESSVVCKHDIKEDVSSRIISVEQTDENRQKKRKREDFNDLKNKDNASQRLTDIDNNAPESNKNDKFSIARKGAEVSIKRTSNITTQKAPSSVCTNDVKDHASSRVISIEQINRNRQKERKSEDFSMENDIRKKDSKNETHDIDAQKIIKDAEISHIVSQKESSVVCKKDIKEDVLSKIISVERTDGNIQKERKAGGFSIDNDSRKKDSKKETLLQRDIDAQKSIKNVEISDSKSQKTSIISVEQTDGNMQKERKSGNFNIDNDIRKKDSKKETLLKHSIDTEKIIKNAEISHIASQKESSVVCKKDIKEDVSSKIISVERTDGNIQKERKSGDFSIDNDSRKKDSKKETLLERDIDAQKSIKNVEISDSKSHKTSIISVEQTDGNMQKERKSGNFNVDNDIRKKDSKKETLSKHSIDTEKIIKNAEISHIASQKESSVVCKKDVKEDVSSKIISVERTDGNIQKERKSGDFSIDNDSRKKDSKKETLLERDIDAQKSIKNVEISDSKSQKTSIISVEQTDGNMQKERKSGNFNIDNDIRKKDSKKETLLKRSIDTEKIIKNAEISDTASQKESSIVCKHDIKEDVSSKIISVEQTDGNIQKEGKTGDFSIDNDSRKKDRKNETGLKLDIDDQKIIKNDEISDSKSQKTSIISFEQTDGNMQKERKSRDFNIDNDIRKKDSKNETLLKRDIDTQKIIKNAEISDTASQKESSVVCKHDIEEDVSSRIISFERTDGNIQKERKLGDFSIDDDTRKKDRKNETLLKRDSDAQKIIQNVEISDSTSQKTSSVVCKDGIKDMSSRVFSVEQIDDNIQKERKSGEFNIHNAIRKEGIKNETLLKYDIDTQKIIKNAEISDIISQKKSLVVCKYDIKEDMSSRIISVEQTDENRQKKRKREDFNDLKNKNNASQRLTDSSKDLQIAACTQPRLATRTDNEDDAPSRIITVSVLCLGDQNEIKISTERNDSKFISDGNEKTLTKVYEFVFNFKKSGSLFKDPYRRTSHSMISGDPTGQSTGPPRIIYRTEISYFLPDRQMPSIKDCIDFLRKHSNEFREYVDKASEKHLLKKFDLRTSAGISEDTDFCEEELRSKKQKERPSILRLFGYEKNEPVELELSDKQEVIKQKVSHSFISTLSDDVSHMSNGQSQNSNSGIPFIAQDEHKSIFSEKSKHPDKSKEVSRANLNSPSKDKYDFVPSPDKEEMPELTEKILLCDIGPMVQNKQFFEDVSIEDLLKDFKLDDDLNEAYSFNILSANIDELHGQNYAKSSHEPNSIYHDYETASEDSDTFSVCSDFDSVFDSVSPNLLDESLSWDNI